MKWTKQDVLKNAFAIFDMDTMWTDINATCVDKKRANLPKRLLET